MAAATAPIAVAIAMSVGGTATHGVSRTGTIGIAIARPTAAFSAWDAIMHPIAVTAIAACGLASS